MTTTIYLINPFKGDINTGTSAGQKIYTLATADRKKEELLLIAQEYVSYIMSVFCHDSKSFGWEALVKNILDKNNKKL